MTTKKLTNEMICVLNKLSYSKIVFRKLPKNIWAWIYSYETRVENIEKIEIDHTKGELLETVVHEILHHLKPKKKNSDIDKLEEQWVKNSSWIEKQDVLLAFLGKTTKKYRRKK